MTTDLSVLTLQPAIHRRTVLDGNVTRRPESHYLDFVINGQLLTGRLHVARGLVTPLNRAWLPTVSSAIEELLGKRTTEGLDPGRVAMFVCGGCGDLACVAITAPLLYEQDRVLWSEFAWDNGYEPADPIQDAPHSIAFARSDYADVFASAAARIAALPCDELERVERKFLWPWQWGWRLPKGAP